AASAPRRTPGQRPSRWFGCGRYAKTRAPCRGPRLQAPDHPRPARHRAAAAGRSSDPLRARQSGGPVPPPRHDRVCALSFDALDENLDLAAAGEPDFPGLVVADPEIEEPRLAVSDHFERLIDHRTFDAAARDRADHRAFVVNRELGADRARRGTPGGDDRRQCHARSRLAPPRRLLKDFRGIAHAALSSFCRHAKAAMPRRVSGALSTSIKVSRPCKLCTGRNSSTYGIIALIPSDLGSKPS